MNTNTRDNNKFAKYLGEIGNIFNSSDKEIMLIESENYDKLLLLYTKCFYSMLTIQNVDLILTKSLFRTYFHLDSFLSDIKEIFLKEEDYSKLKYIDKWLDEIKNKI